METNRVTLLCALILLSAVSITYCELDTKHPRWTREVEEQPEIDDEENESSFWITKAQNTLEEKLQIEINKNKARNVILFLGDGMSVPTITAARIYQNQLDGGKEGEGSSLFFETFPYTALSKTYCVDLKVADSACSATAYLTGVKGNEGTIGVNGKVARGDCVAMRDPRNQPQSIAKWFQDAGRASGIVTTTRVTHASPAGVYAHTAERGWENDQDISNAGEDSQLCDDIAEQLVLQEPGRNFNVILGGGSGAFLPENKEGYRQDGKNLIESWKNQRNDSFLYVTTRDDLLNITNTPNYLMGLFGKSHMDYHLDNNEQQPTLAEMTQKAIEVLRSTKEGSEEGYFLFVEGGKIDLAHHDNQAHLALDETVEFAKAIAIAKAMTDEADTLIVVTADHAHTMSFSGYPARAASIFSLGGNGDDGKPYTALNYANGPGYQKPVDNGRPDITNDDIGDNYYKFPAAVPLGSETHGGDDVAIFAVGPWAHLFTGSLEENYIPHAMAYASCVGDGKISCE